MGLRHMPATGTSLLLNIEGVFTVLLAWFAFCENFGRRNYAFRRVGVLSRPIRASMRDRPCAADQIMASAVLVTGVPSRPRWGVDGTLVSQ